MEKVKVTADLNLRKEHIKSVTKLTPYNRLKWALTTGWAAFDARPPEKQKIYLKMRKVSSDMNVAVKIIL